MELVINQSETEPAITYDAVETVEASGDSVEAGLSLPQRILGSRLGRLTAAALCSFAVSSAVGTEAAAHSPAPAVIKAEPAGPKPKQFYGVGQAILTDCANPPASAPAPAQLKAFNCLMVQAQKAASDTPPMVLDPDLNQSAGLKTRDITTCEISHYACERPFNFYMPKIFGCYGENIAWGVAGYGSMQSLYKALMASPEHRENIENPDWDVFGSAMLRFNGINYITTQFGSYSRCEA